MRGRELGVDGSIAVSIHVVAVASRIAADSTRIAICTIFSVKECTLSRPSADAGVITTTLVQLVKLHGPCDHELSIRFKYVPQQNFPTFRDASSSPRVSD